MIFNYSIEDAKEKKLVVRRASKAQHIGLTVMTLNTPKGLSLFVADVPSSGLIAQAQLSLKRGDEILKINGFDFQEDPNLETLNDRKAKAALAALLSRAFANHF